MNAFAQYIGYTVMVLCGGIAVGLLCVYCMNLLMNRLADSVGGYFKAYNIIRDRQRQQKHQPKQGESNEQ